MNRSNRQTVLLWLFIAVFCLGAAGILTPVFGKSETSDEEPYELVMQWISWNKDDSENIQKGIEQVEEALNEITIKKINVRVVLKQTDNPSFETNLMVSSGEKLDLCVSLYGGVPELVANGYLLSLDDLMEEYGQGIKEVCGSQMAGGYYQNQLYGIPVAYTEGQRYGFICRTDLMEKYDFQLEDGRYYTFDELEEFWKKVKAGEGEDFYILGGSMICKDELLEKSGYAFDVLGSGVETGVLMLNESMENTKIENFYETEEFKEFAAQMYRWQQEGFFAPNTSISELNANLLMKEGKTLGWFFHNVPGEEVENASDSGLEVSFIPTQEAIRTTDANQNVLWSIPITCEKPEKAMEFMNLLYTDSEVSNLLQRGIEGESYVVAEENENGKLIDFPEGKNLETIPYYVNGGLYGNRLEAYTWVPGDINHNQTAKEFSDNIKYTSPARGYVFDSSNMFFEVSRIKDVIQKYIGVIETGSVDPEVELPLFLSELKEAGIDSVIEENQRQYDEWRTKNTES